jgi:O-methyltransferase involved in polyketide biosynthesis
MNPQTASRTALRTSLMRALHTRSDPKPILNDPWGDRLVSANHRALIYASVRSRNTSLPENPDDTMQRSVIDASVRASMAYPNVIVRSRYAEDALHRAAASGMRQWKMGSTVHY